VTEGGRRTEEDSGNASQGRTNGREDERQLFRLISVVNFSREVPLPLASAIDSRISSLPPDDGSILTTMRHHTNTQRIATLTDDQSCERMGQGRSERDKESVRDKERDSPAQMRSKPAYASNILQNYPNSSPQSMASSSMCKFPYEKPTPTPAPASALRAPAPSRARETRGPSIATVMVNMSLNPHGHGVPAFTNPTTALAARARIQIVNPIKRGVIPPCVRTAGSLVSATSGSSSSTNISDGSFTDYVRWFSTHNSHAFSHPSLTINFFP
jgi:hypothetical protein